MRGALESNCAGHGWFRSNAPAWHWTPSSVPRPNDSPTPNSGHRPPCRPATRKMICLPQPCSCRPRADHSTPRSEEHTSELQSLMRISYAVFCLKKKNKIKTTDLLKHYHNKIDTRRTNT